METLPVIHPAQSLTVNDFYQILKTVQPKDFNDIIISKSPSLRAISHFKSPDVARNLIIVQLSEICKLLSFSITEDMILECANNINHDFWDCKIDDLKLFRSYLMRDMIDLDLYRNDALVLYKLFKHYYKMRYNALQDVEDQKYSEEKEMWRNSMGRAWANASPEIKAETGELMEKLEKLSASKRISEDRDRPVPIEKMELDEVCAEKGMPYDRIFNIVSEKCRQEFNKDIGISFETFLALRLKAVLFSARKDENFLETLINET